MRRALAALLVVVAAALAGSAMARVLLPPPPAPATQLAVEQRLMCPQCSGVRLDVCDLPVCTDMKQDIQARLAAGESPGAIVDSYAAVYGTRVLAGRQAPAGSLPLLVLALLLAGTGLVLGRRRRPPAGEVVSTNAAADRRVERALSQWRGQP